jgi:GAF domain-containing protein
VASSHPLPFLEFNAHEEPFSRGLIASALQTGAIAFSNDIQTDSNMLHWHQVDILQAFHSAAAVPFSLDGTCFGVFNLYTADLDFFMVEQEKNLLEEIGLDISFALDTLEYESKRKRAEEKTEKQLRRLSALRAIDMAITSSLDLRVTLNVLLDHVSGQLQVDAAAVLLLDPNLNELKFAAGRGFHGSGMSRTRLKLGESQAGKAALERRTVCIPDLSAAGQPFTQVERTAGEDFAAFFAVPLVAKGQIKGVLEVFHRTRLEPDSEWLDFLETLAGQAAIAVDGAQLFDGLQRSNTELTLAYDATIEGWSMAMELRDKETEGHTRRGGGFVGRASIGPPLPRRLAPGKSTGIHSRPIWKPPRPQGCGVVFSGAE